MHQMVESKLEAIAESCHRNHVRKAELFGSATSNQFHPDHSDIDFLVSFDDLPPGEYADAYFGLLEDLQEIFHRPVDIVVESTLKNPYFLQEVQKSRTVLYAT